MAVTTQEIQKGIDLTGLTEVSGSELNQSVDVARPATDRGQIIVTTDSALNTPVVPDPDTEISGITPIWWKNYIWKRVVYGSTKYKLYVWNAGAVSDATYLKWENINADAEQALQDAANAANDADTALIAAQSAVTQANTANTNASSAASSVADVAADVAVLQTTLAALQTTVSAVVPTGTVVGSFNNTTYSIHADQGYLELNGAEVKKSVFANLYNLFTALGLSFGVAVDAANNFVLPDFRGKFLMGRETGGTNPFSVGDIGTTGGEAEVTLTSGQSGVAPHSHVANIIINTGAGASIGIDRASSKDVTDIDDMVTIEDAEAADAAEAHNNLPPYIKIRWLIKT